MAEEKEKSITWRAAEYEYRKKGRGWYIAIITVTLLIAVFALWQRNFFFMVFILIAGLMVIVLGNKKPRVVDFYIDEEEVRVGNDIAYSYGDIEWYAIVNRENELNQIVIKTTSKINPVLKLRADSKITPKAREVLSEKLEEKTYEPSMIELFSDILKF